MGSLGAASSESGAASPLSVAADWHRDVRDLVYFGISPRRLRVFVIKINLALLGLLTNCSRVSTETRRVGGALGTKSESALC